MASSGTRARRRTGAKTRTIASPTDEIDTIERATNELHARCLEAVQHVIDEKRYAELQIPEHAIPLIERTWKEEPPIVYGRFDLAYDGKSPPMMLEYNADTPTSLLEASVIQWDWLEAKFTGADQFNSIHERLVAHWREMMPYLRKQRSTRPARALRVDGRHRGRHDDRLSRGDGGAGGTAREAARAWATSAGIPARASSSARTTSASTRCSSSIRGSGSSTSRSASSSPKAKTTFVEPAWKMVLSNKGILAILWDLFPGHPNLRPAFFDEPNGMFEYVKKPLLSREGANVTVHTMKEHLESTRRVRRGGLCLSGARQHSGSSTASVRCSARWIIGQEAAGMGIRESEGWVTGNTSRFVPHLFR